MIMASGHRLRLKISLAVRHLRGRRSSFCVGSQRSSTPGAFEGILVNKTSSCIASFNLLAGSHF